jgi:hypothetical protein
MELLNDSVESWADDYLGKKRYGIDKNASNNHQNKSVDADHDKPSLFMKSLPIHQTSTMIDDNDDDNDDNDDNDDDDELRNLIETRWPMVSLLAIGFFFFGKP